MEGAFALQLAALAGRPQQQWKRDGLKVALSTWVFTRSHELSAIDPRLCGQPLTKRDIFDAFHAFARDLGFKRDQTLPVEEETFCRRITREKRFRTSVAWDIFNA